MSRWAVVIPSPQEANLLSNPSFEKDTAGWTAVGATLTRVSSQQKRGVYSLSIAPTSGVNDGAYATVTTTVTPHGFGIDVLGVAGVPYLIRWADSSGNLLGTATTFTGTGKWQRVWVGWNESSATTRRVYVSKNNHASTGTFYVDGAKVSAEAAESTYFDGDTKGFYAGDYYWLGAAHASQSVRKAYIRHGGRIADFETEFGLLVEGHMGFGLGKIANILLPLALVGGAVFQRQVPQERSAALVVSFTGSSEQDLQQKRQKAVAALGPGLYGRDEPAMLLYRAGDGVSTQNYLEIPALYEGGLDGARSKGYTENAALQFTLYLPYVMKQGNSAAVLTTRINSAPTGTTLLRRDTDGTWKGTLNTTIKGAVVGPDGMLYLYGTFTTLAGVTNATGVAKYDPNTHTVTALGTGIPTPQVSCAKFGPDGNLYVTGAFAGAGGVATTNGIARWNMTSQAWESIGEIDAVAGHNRIGWSLDWDTKGNLWLAGNFGTVASVANTKKVAYYDGAWHAAGTGATGIGTDSGLLHVISDKKGGVYVYGFVSNVGGVSNTGTFAHWNGTTLAWESLGALTSVYYSAGTYVQGDRILVWGEDGRLYMPNAVCNGSALLAWQPGLVGPLTLFKYRGNIAAPNSISSAPVFAVLPDAAGGIMWNGATWEYLIDIFTYNTPFIQYLLDYNGVTYAFTNSNGPLRSSAATTITNNSTHAAYPKFVFSGYGRLFLVRNLTTGKEIQFNYVVKAGETVTLDLTPGSISFINDAGLNLQGYILPGTDLQTFALQPGTNVIVVQGDVPIGSGTAYGLTGTMQWTENHLGIDGGSN